MRRASVFWIVLFLASAGCGGDDALNSPTAVRLKGLAAMYLDHVASRGGAAPASEEDFRKYLKAVPEFNLTGNNIDPKNIDALFISERDKQPFVVVYGQRVSEISGNSKQLVAYEKTGKDGKRLVAFASTRLDHVDDTQFEQLKSGKK